MERYLDKNLTPEERADDLLAKMDLDEKFGQIQCWAVIDGFMGRVLEKIHPCGAGQVSCLPAAMMPSRNDVAALVRSTQEKIMALSAHHIPAIVHVETLTGPLVTDSISFPCGIAQASTWDPALQQKAGAVIGHQARAMGFAQGLAPVLDLCRDPRFGRQGEGYGEDPTLASAMGTAYVRGLQKDNQTVATSKHFLGFMAGQGGIHSARTSIEERELREIYAKPFQAAITEAGLGSVMNSYASINGEPVVGSKHIFRDLLRGEMGFDGITVSDYSSVGQLETVHHVSDSTTESGRLALEAGMDQELPNAECYNDELKERIRNGEVDPALLDEAVRRILVAKFRLGLFENPFPAEDLSDAAYETAAAKKLSLQSAEESLILLKNDGILPAAPAGKKVAVIGWHANNTRALFGGYHAMSMKESSVGITLSMAGISVDADAPVANNSVSDCYPGSDVHKEHPAVEPLVRKSYPGIHSLLDALRTECPDAEFVYAEGYPYAGNDESGFAEALEAAKNADIVICTLGGHYGWNMSSTTGEGIDSSVIGLPDCQEAFLNQLGALHKPVIGVHFDGRPCSSDAADRVCNALVEAWAPGEFGGDAIARILLGKAEPSGKLPCTVARDAGQIPVYYNHLNGSSYALHNSMAFNSYVNEPHEPRYYFGHGLHYTEFAYEKLTIEKDAFAPDEAVVAHLTVKNTGSRPGTEIAQLYVKDLTASVIRPVQELQGFARIALQPGEEKTVTFTLPLHQLAFLDLDMKWKVEAGKMQLLAGPSSNELPLCADFTITAESYINGTDRGFFTLGV